MKIGTIAEWDHKYHRGMVVVQGEEKPYYIHLSTGRTVRDGRDAPLFDLRRPLKRHPGISDQIVFCPDGLQFVVRWCPQGLWKASEKRISHRPQFRLLSSTWYGGKPQGGTRILQQGSMESILGKAAPGDLLPTFKNGRWEDKRTWQRLSQGDWVDCMDPIPSVTKAAQTEEEKGSAAAETVNEFGTKLNFDIDTPEQATGVAVA